MLGNEIARFGFVGIVATAVHLAVASMLLQFYSSLHVVVINSLSFCVAFFVSYVGHRYVTFRQQGSLIKFLIITLLGLLCNNIVVFSAAQFIDTRIISIIIGVLSAPILVFILSKFWVFIEK